MAPAARRHGIGLELIDKAAQQAARDKRHFLSVSFGYTAALWRFWQRAGFQLVNGYAPGSKQRHVQRYGAAAA